MYCVKILFQTVLKTMGQIQELLLLITVNIPLMHKVSFNPFSSTLVSTNLDMICVTLIVTS